MMVTVTADRLNVDQVFVLALESPPKALGTMASKETVVYETRIIATLPDPTYALTRPIMVIVENSLDGHVASIGSADIHMSGDTSADALRNVLFMAIDLFHILGRNVEHLGPGPLKNWHFLKDHIELLNAQQG